MLNNFKVSLAINISDLPGSFSKWAGNEALNIQSYYSLSGCTSLHDSGLEYVKKAAGNNHYQYD
jgi:hypothetical protein